VQIFEYLQLDLKKYMGQDKKKNHLPVPQEDLKVPCPCECFSIFMSFLQCRS
jgi:hypothetical protein